MATFDDAGLTSREREVFWLVAERLRNREISERLHIGIRTVESHVSTILRKLGAEQRDEIVELAGRLAPRRINGASPPAPLSSFIGRDAEVAELTRRVAEERLTTVVGPPGVGKTRLVFHVARTAVGLPPPVLVDLSTTTADEDLLRTFTMALGLTEGGMAVRATLHEALRAEPAWLIVDNCEHVEEAAAALVRELLGVAPGLRILATSRSPLGVDGERVLHLDPLDVPASGAEPTAGLDAPACRLFLDRAHRRSEGGSTPDHAGHVSELCRRLDGLPLAIELVAAQTRWFSVVELLTQVDDHLLAFDARRPGLPDRHRTIAAAVLWSYDLLDDDERCLLARCSVFPGAFELDTLVDVAAFGTIDGGRVVRLLPRLVDRSLVVARELPDGTTTYRLLDSIRTFARARLHETGDREAVEERHARRHLERAVVVGAELRTRRQDGAIAWFDRRRSDLTLSMRWVLARDEVDAAWTFVAGVGLGWLIAGPRREVLEWIDRLLARPLPNGALGAKAALTSAYLLCFTDTARALALATGARTRLETMGAASDLRAWSDLTVGKALALLGRREEAAALLDGAVAAFRAAGDHWHEALGLQALGHNGTDVDAALGSYRRSARRFRELGDDVMLANTLTLMIVRALNVREPDLEAVEGWLAESRDLAERTDSQWELAHVELNEAKLRWHRGEHGLAEQGFRTSLAAFRQMVDRRCASTCLVGLGEAAIARGDDEAAVVLLRSAAEEAERMEYGLSVAVAVRLLAAIDARAGDAAQAALLLGRADVAEERIDPSRRAALPDVEDLRRRATAALGADRFAALVAEGRAAAPAFPW